jgi:heat shock protein HslJ
MKPIASGTLIMFLLATFACGDANSNNLPQRNDTAAITSGTPDSARGAGVESAVAGADSANRRNDRTSPITPAAADTGTLQGTWFLVAVLPSDTAAGRIPWITFDKDGQKFTGHTGCNNMRGSYSKSDSTLRINEQIITTKMACPGYNEDRFLKSLPKVTGYKFENGMLVLLNDRNELSRWTRQAIKPTNKIT